MRRNQKGFTLVEIVVAMSIMSLVLLSVYGSWNFILKVLQGAKSRTVAVGIAAEKIEIIRNFPYDDIGIIGGVPAGGLKASEQIIRDGEVFTAKIDVRYIDDPFDGVAPADTLNIDYKQVRVEVSWRGYDTKKPVVMWTNVAPRGVESIAGGGTLRIEVIDAQPQGVANASVHVVNTAVGSPIDVTLQTNDDGILLLPGSPVSGENYQITVSKEGYSSAQTYTRDAVSNPQPNPPHLSVQEGLLSSKLFTIDHVAQLHIRTQDESAESLADVPFTLSGTNHIGYDDQGKKILKYNQQHVTGDTGQLDLADLDFDTYMISVDPQSGYDIAGADPLFPLVLHPGDDTNFTLVLAPHSNHSLLVNIVDSSDAPVTAASVRLYRDGYDTTVESGTSGYVFFRDLQSGLYTLEVSAPSYQNFSLPVDVLNQTFQRIPLSSS